MNNGGCTAKKTIPRQLCLSTRLLCRTNGETRAYVLCRKKTQKKQRVEVGVASREEQIDGSLTNREGSQTHTNASIDGKHSENES